MPPSAGNLARVFGLLLSVAPLVAQAGKEGKEPVDEPPPFHKPERIGLLPEKVIPECSGLARSRKYPGLVWTHNDSGEAPELFAVRLDGTIVRRLVLPAVANFDWEDLALDAADRLVVADIGDNFAARAEIVLYRAEEPDPAAVAAPRRVETFRFHYPSKFGPVDAEALFVRGECAFVVTKEKKTARLVRLPLCGTGEATAAPALAESIGALEGLQHVTGACLADDGRHLALLTYLQVVVLDLDEPLQADLPGPQLLATLHKARRRQQWLFLGQSEGITFDGASLLVGTEKGPLATRPSLWRLVPN